MSQFYIPSATPSSDSNSFNLSDEEDNLPYPAELPRNDFLAPDFDPQAYLSSLHNRHQTLEDLRSDLRQRSQLLNTELLDVANANYEDLLSLGGGLRGGEEKVESVRVGLLGFQREVEGIRRAVQEREAETRQLLEERKGVREDVMLGRALLEVDERLEELEEALGVRDTMSLDDDDDDTDESSDPDTVPDDDAAKTSIPTKKLRRHATQYLLLTRLVMRIGPSHPFIVAQRPRLEVVKTALLLDLAAALRSAKMAKAGDAMLSVSRIYADLGMEGEGIKVLKDR